MIKHIKELLDNAIVDLIRDEVFSTVRDYKIHVERTRDKTHGDYASNIALLLAKPLSMSPQEIAQKIIAQLPESQHVEQVNIAGPGFINFFLTEACQKQVIKKILKKQETFSQNNMGQEKSITVEFVSANPTGPLHVGHGRGAAFGSSLANLLKKCGYEVHQEYYVNDHGRQMDILATSVWLRYLELCGERVVFPSNGYKGNYITEIARIFRKKYGDDWRVSSLDVYDGITEDEPAGGDKEKHIDDLINKSKELLGKGYKKVFKLALEKILAGIAEDMENFNVVYDEWFSESSLHDSGTIEKALEILQENGHLYKKDGAVWFNATHFGDEKDRVVVRENGQKTYFASDIAYLLNKYEREFDQSIYVLGADHHGYIARLKAAAQALNLNPDQLEILLVQFAHLFSSGEKLPMSTRSGEFITLSELIDEVGRDAARFFYVMRSHEQHLDFDMDLAKSQSNDNPVYYIQYAHARICSLFANLEDLSFEYNREIGLAAMNMLNQPHEIDLIRGLSQYPEVVESAGRNRSVHTVANYLRELAQQLHSYYNAHQILVEDENLRNVRLNLCEATRIVLADGLGILGTSAPHSMYSEDKKQ